MRAACRADATNAAVDHAQYAARSKNQTSTCEGRPRPTRGTEARFALDNERERERERAG
jgi:hypothetical protein